MITANGGTYSPGIGCAYYQGGGEIVINGGKIYAQGGSRAPGIGGGYYGKAGGSVTINGGLVSAAADVSEGGGMVVDAIGKGYFGANDYTVTVSGGAFAMEVKTEWLAEGYAIYDNINPDTRAEFPYAVYFGEPTPTITVGELKNITAVWTSGEGTVTNAIEGTSFTVPLNTENVQVILTPAEGYVLNGDAVLSLGTVIEDMSIASQLPVACLRKEASYVDENGEAKSVTAIIVTSDFSTLYDGWYVIDGNISRGQITVNGAAKLILEDGAKLSVDGGDEKAGMAVGEGSSLTIYGQQAGTGELKANGGTRAAGIGGNKDSACGTVTIVGGTVTATHETNGVGIGAGAGGNGGTVAISGGRVDVDGIGCGNKGTPAAVSITGGVFAKTVEEAWLKEGYMVLANIDEETREAYPYAVYPEGNVTITVGEIKYMTAVWTSGDGTVTNVIEGTSFEVERGTENIRLIFTADEDYELIGEDTYTFGTAIVDCDISADIPTAVQTPVPYLAWDAENKVLTNAFARVYEFVTSETATFEDGKWYVVRGGVSRNATIEVTGAANLILTDGSKLTVVGSGEAAGINVAKNRSLTIFAQEGGTGAIDATGSRMGAGIGSGKWQDRGDITVRGGTISARGGSLASNSSIGPGYGSGDTGGKTVISGGIFAFTIRDDWRETGCAIFENPDLATASAYPWTVQRGCKVTVGNRYNVNVKWTDGTVTNEVTDTYFYIDYGHENVKMLFTTVEGFVLKGEDTYEFGTITANEDVDITEQVPEAALKPFEYLAWDDERKVLTNAVAEVCELVTPETTTFEDGKWYSVKGEVSRNATIAVNGAANLILMDGSKLTVVGSGEAAGINVAKDNSLTIYAQEGGTGALDATGSYMGAGIGSGKWQDRGDITIRGGAITARGGSFASNSSIGPGYASGDTGGKTVISGGIFAFTIRDDWRETGCAIFENPDLATASAYPWTVRRGCKVTIGNHYNVNVKWTDGTVTNEVTDTYFYIDYGHENVKMLFTPVEGFVLKGEDTYEFGTITANEDVDITEQVPTAGFGSIEYLAWDDERKVLTNAVAEVCEPITAATETLEDGKWYAVKGEVTRSTITVNGSANLILCDGAKLTLNGEYFKAGLAVNDGNAVTIYAQAGGTGELTAVTGYYGGGIGGDDETDCGSVTIHGGRITARGYNGADIGPGDGGKQKGTITITGGIFGMTVRDDWVAARCEVIDNPDEETKDEYPHLVQLIPGAIVTIGELENMTAAWTSGDGTVTNEVSGSWVNINYGLENVKIIFTPAEGFALIGEESYDLGTITEDVDISEYVPTAALKPVEYLAWDDERKVLTNAVANACELVTPETTTFEDGKWYAVKGEVSRGATIEVNGAANLILMDGSKLTVVGSGQAAGISVLMHRSLTIYAQEGGTGALDATGSSLGAGIGSGKWQDRGDITIRGGAITARGGRYVPEATIGPGYGSGDTGGKTVISGGIFGMTVKESWLAEGCEVIDNPDEETKSAYPYLVRTIPPVTVTVGELNNMTAAWTSGAGTVTNTLEGVAFEVLPGTENVKVLFTAAEGYEFFTSDVIELGTVEEDVTLTAEQIPVAYKKDDFSARFVQTGNGIGRIEIADHGLSRKIDITFPVTDGEVSRTYTSDLSGRSTNLTFGVIFVDDNDSVVLPKDPASNPSYLNKDDKIKAFPGRYLPKDIKVKDDTVTLYNYGVAFEVGGIEIVTESNKKEKKESLVDGIVSFLRSKKHSSGSSYFDILSAVFGGDAAVISFITEYTDVFVEEFIDEINDVASTIKKLKKLLEMLKSIMTRLSATVYIGDGDDDDDYYTAEHAPKAFNEVSGTTKTVHYMRNARTPAYTAKKKLSIDMHGAPKVDVTALSKLIEDIDFGEGTPDFVNELIEKMVEEALKLGADVFQKAVAADHVSAQSNNGSWLTVAEGATVTISNFNPEGGSVGSGLSTSLIAVNSGSLTLNKVTMMNYNVSDKSAVIRVNNGATLTLTEACKITGSGSGNVFVAPTATLSAASTASRVGISGQTEDGDAFAWIAKGATSWATYLNDAHPNDSAYSIVKKEDRLYWLYTPQGDPDDPDFPKPGEESDGVAINIRLITLSDGTEVARLWGSPVNGMKGGWYYLEAASDLKGEFKYLKGYKWKASKDGAVTEMQQGPERSCCDVPTEGVKTRFFRFRAQREEP